MTDTSVGTGTQLWEELVWELNTSIEPTEEENTIYRNLHPGFSEQCAVVSYIPLEGSSVYGSKGSSEGS